MFVELHILQNFAPSNLNRDDTGSPKDCEFGGFRRARISSQCLKRATRTAFGGKRLLPDSHLAARTKRLVDELVRRLHDRGKDPSSARSVAEVVLKGMGLAVDAEGRTQYLLFLGHQEIEAIVEQCLAHWEDLAQRPNAASSAEESETSAKRRTAKDAKKAGREAVPATVAAAIKAALDGGKAADLALFGRMLADLPDRNIDAASQVAHAVSTHRVSMEFDFYTAVDDLKPEETAGADMLGTVEFNSACFYRYSNVDLEQLRLNLGGDEELTTKTLEAFLRASIGAIPTGKQNSMAAHNPPSTILAVARRLGLSSLVNAFVKPVRATQERDLVQGSLHALDDYWHKLVTMYGSGQILGAWICTLEDDGLDHLAGARVATVEDLVRGVISHVAFEPERKSARA